MKRFLSCLLIIVLIVSCTACNKSTETEIQIDEAGTTSDLNDEIGTSIEDSDEVTSEDSFEEDLIDAVTLIKEAEELIKSMASTQLSHWTTYSNILSYYFVDEDYEEAGESSIAGRAEQLHRDRTKATEKLAEAKSLMGTTRAGEFYNAVKDYYLLVNNYLSLVSTFPEGYSELTFSSTVSDFNNDCQSLYNELAFYIE